MWGLAALEIMRLVRQRVWMVSPRRSPRTDYRAICQFVSMVQEYSSAWQITLSLTEPLNQ
jgi:hypothetical protein